jgi:diacylglycerol kinase family enzyme
MADRPRVTFIVNPISGGAGGRRGAAIKRAMEVLRGRMEEAGGAVSIAETDRPGGGEQIAAQACRDGARAVVVVGGDGTINDAVRGMTGGGVPILMIPAGTENVLAKYFGITADGERLWQVFRQGAERRIDVAEVAARDERGHDIRRRFLLMAGIGFDAAMVQGVSRRRSELVRKGGGRISHCTYLPVAARLLLRFRHPSLRVEADGEPIDVGPALVLVGNVPRYAMGLQPWGEADPSDGRLDLSIFPCGDRLALIRHFTAVLLGRTGSRGGAVHRKAGRIRITSPNEDVPVQVDGDLVGRLPAELSLTGEQARFLAPR